MSKKGAQKSGGRDNSARDKARAAHMKKHNVVRRVMRCPITNKLIPVGAGFGKAQA